MDVRIIMVHGSLSSAQEWSKYVSLLPEDDVVAVDLPGHGERMGEKFSTASAMDVISEAVDATDEDVPILLVGHSLGGYMALAWASRNPGRLAGLALLGASADPASPLAWLYRGFAWFTGKVNHSRLASVRNRVGVMLGVKIDDLPAAAAYEVLPDAWQSVFDDCSPEQLVGIDCPVLFLNGQFDQMRLGEKKVIANAASSRHVLVPKATHLAPLTHAEIVAAELHRWADELPRVAGRDIVKMPRAQGGAIGGA